MLSRMNPKFQISILLYSHRDGSQDCSSCRCNRRDGMSSNNFHGFSRDIWESGQRQHRQTGKYFPSPSKILQHPPPPFLPVPHSHYKPNDTQSSSPSYLDTLTTQHKPPNNRTHELINQCCTHIEAIAPLPPMLSFQRSGLLGLWDFGVGIFLLVFAIDIWVQVSRTG